MCHYKYLFILPIFVTIKLSLCQNSTSVATKSIYSNNYHVTANDDSARRVVFCDYFNSKDIINDTFHFNFSDREDYGPIYLSDDELKQIYCEIKRGSIEAYKILCLHYFYSHSQYISRSDLDKLICITDFLTQKYNYYKGYLICGNYIFDYLESCADDYYAAIMITYYEKFFELSHSKTVAQKLYEIYCGNYSFHDKDSIKARYYEEFIFSN